MKIIYYIFYLNTSSNGAALWGHISEICGGIFFFLSFFFFNTFRPLRLEVCSVEQQCGHHPKACQRWGIAEPTPAPPIEICI